MATLINLYNQAGAGPKTLSLNFINHLSGQPLSEYFHILVPDYQEYAALESTNKYIHLIKLPRKENFLGKVWYRIYLEFIFIPYFLKKNNIRKLLAFGNFLLTPGFFLKLVLVHHPYLFDNQLLSRAPFGTRMQEHLKRLGFFFTLLNTKHLVVESTFVANRLKETWGVYLNKKTIHVISNPVSEKIGVIKENELLTLIPSRFGQTNSELKILFVSRYYPHKNHRFLIDLSKALSKCSIKHQIIVTVNEEISEAKLFLDDISSHKLSIKNLGEIDQTALQAFYKSSHLLIFPSKSETFGIPMIEAMAYGLPLVVPRLGYAEAIVGTAGNYYESDNIELCVKTIQTLTNNFAFYKQRSLDSLNELNGFPTPKFWVKSYLDALSSSD